MPVKKLHKFLPQRPGTFIPYLRALKLADTLDKLSQHFGDNMPPVIKEDELSIPNTPIAIAATELSSKLNKPSIYNHSIRAYMFGICIGKYLNSLNDNNQNFDRELFYISCILCKIGLSDEIRNLSEYTGKDYELIGAEYSHQFLGNNSYNKTKCDFVHEAIVMQTNPDVLTDQYVMQTETQLVLQGGVLDTVGRFKYNVRQEMIDMITKQYPRKDFAKEYRELLIREATEKPHSCVAADICGGLDPLIMLNTLDPHTDHGYPL